VLSSLCDSGVVCFYTKCTRGLARARYNSTRPHKQHLVPREFKSGRCAMCTRSGKTGDDCARTRFAALCHVTRARVVTMCTLGSGKRERLARARGWTADWNFCLRAQRESAQAHITRVLGQSQFPSPPRGSPWRFGRGD
jgi:hypothetical protein